MIYKQLQKLFKEPVYHPTKFVCKACENTLKWRDLYCSACDRTVEWCTVVKERTSFAVKV